jgi:hypothetical protein
MDEVQIDWRIAFYALAAAVTVTFVCGLLPAIRATAGSLNLRFLRTAPRHGSGRHRMQWTLAAIQMAIAVVLLVAAGLLVRTLQEIGRVSPGFEVRSILTFHVSGSFAETQEYGRMTRRIDRTLDMLRTIPGVEAAATSAALPGVPDDPRSSSGWSRVEPRISRSSSPTAATCPFRTLRR